MFPNLFNFDLVKRVFIVGPPGSERKDFAKRAKDKFPLTVIETGSLLKKEVTKKTDHAEAIQKAFENRVLGKFYQFLNSIIISVISFCLT